MSTARLTTWQDRLTDLGNVPADRIRTDPQPGTATLADVIHLHDTEGKLYELVDGTLVEKAMGWQESLLAGLLLHWIHNYLDKNPLGVATGPDGMTRLFGDTVRGPDVAFVNWARLPEGKLPSAPIPDLVPNFVIEVLSASNTYSEMSRKRREYFHAGVELVWMVHPRERTITAYENALHPTVVGEGQTLDATKVLPGFTVSTTELFSRLDGQPPPT
jgi:Uma2 family endonuclease